MNLTEFSKEVHANAVAHGWWEEERTIDDIIVLCHGELSEAVEEYRANRPMLWYECEISKCHCIDETCKYYEDGGCRHKKRKPEGIAVEMVDCLLRILDYAGKGGWDCKIEKVDFLKADKFNFTECVADLHNDLSTAWVFAIHAHKDEPKSKMLRCAGKIVTWLEANYGGNWLELLELKHEYNKSRPYKHGGKKV